MDSKAATVWLQRYYDKVITGVVLVVLLVSVVYLCVQLGAMERKRVAEERKIENITIEHPELAAVDVTPYEQALVSLQQPTHVDASNWTYSLFVPAERIFCPACSKPSLATGDVCSLCGAELPKGAGLRDDKDEDGLPDLWETKYGLDPARDTDAMMDGDADGFDNLAEFKGQTDPTSATSVPDLDAFITLKDLIPNKFNLMFVGKVTLPGGIVKYQLNVKDKTKKTHLKKMGELVDDGFKLVGYQERIETNGMKRTDLSVLKLKRGDRVISLTRSRPQEHQDYTAVLGCSLDSAWARKGTRGNVFELTWKTQSEKYKIKEIDSGNRIVVLGRLRDGKDVRITDAAGPEQAVEKVSTPVPGGSDD